MRHVDDAGNPENHSQSHRRDDQDRDDTEAAHELSRQ
jgi:hypothetical protein